MKNLRFLSGKKYLTACAIAFMLGGKLSAQSVHPDSIRTLTHTNPITLAPREKPKQPSVVFVHPDDAVYAELKSFANVTVDNTQAVLFPVIAARPFMRIKNTVTIGATTTMLFQNYTTETISPIVQDLYAYVNVNTKIGRFYTKVGKFSELSYTPEMTKYIPGSSQFINMVDMSAGHYLPRAAVVGFQNKITRISIGYAEDTPGVKLTGHGGVVFTMEYIIEENWKFGGTVFVGQDHTSGEIQSIYTLINHDVMLIQVLGLGTRPAVYAAYKHSFRDDMAAIVLNGFYQFDDGIAGGNITLCHPKSGVYVAGGAIYHDPLRQTTPDGTPNENYNKTVPFFEIGINKTLFPRGK